MCDRETLALRVGREGRPPKLTVVQFCIMKSCKSLGVIKHLTVILRISQ